MAASTDLRGKRRLFVDYYLGESKGNATDAARKAGYRFPSQEGCRLLRQPDVKAAVEERLAEVGVTRERLLAALVEILGIDVGLFLEVAQTAEGPEVRLRVEAVEEKPPAGIPGAEEDPGKVTYRLAGPTHLLRVVNAGRYGLRIEALDKLKAIQLLGRFLGMWAGKEEEGDEQFDEFAKAIMEAARKAAV